MKKIQSLFLFSILSFFTSCQKEQERIITIINDDLSEIPDSVFKVRNLTSLTISMSGFTLYPPLSALREQIQTIPLSEIPEEIGNLSSLTNLSINGTKITQLLNSISNLKNIRTLNLSFNPYLSIKNEIQKLKRLKKLKYLNITMTKSLPEDIEYIKKQLPKSVKLQLNGF